MKTSFHFVPSQVDFIISFSGILEFLCMYKQIPTYVCVLFKRVS